MSITDDKLKERSPTVPVKQLRKLVNKTALLTDDTPITLELVLTALFPKVYFNIQEYGKDCFTAGYLQAKKEIENEDKGN